MGIIQPNTSSVTDRARAPDTLPVCHVGIESSAWHRVSPQDLQVPSSSLPRPTWVLGKVGCGRVPGIPEVGRRRERGHLGLATVARSGSSGSTRDRVSESELESYGDCRHAHCAHHLLWGWGVGVGVGVGASVADHRPSSCVSSPGVVANGGCHHLRSCCQRYSGTGLDATPSPFPLGKSVHLRPSHPGENHPGPRGPFCAPRAAKGWALALLQLLGAQGGENQRQAMWAPLSSLSFKEVQTNPVPMPGARSLLTAPACPSPSALPSQKEDRALVAGHPEGPDGWRSRQCLAGAKEQQKACLSGGGGARRLKPFTLSHCGPAWSLGATHSG